MWRRNQSRRFRLWLSFRNGWLRSRLPFDLRLVMETVDLNRSKFRLRWWGDGLRDHSSWLFNFGFGGRRRSSSRRRESWLAN